MRNLEIKNNDSLSRKGRGSQSGRSMIEMLGVLAIIGVLSVGGIAGYSKAMTKYRINKAIEQITLIAGNVRAFWGPQKNYIGVHCYGNNCNASGCFGHSGVNANGNSTWAYNGCPIVKKAKIFPDEMITVTDGKIMSITNPFGGRVDLLTRDKAKYADNQAFSIYYSIGDNVEACIELLTHGWTSANVKAIAIDDGDDPFEEFFKIPVSVDLAVTRCSAAMNAAKAISPMFPYIDFYFDIDLNGSIWNPKPSDAGGNDWQN
ncbi:MAG: hypothetical protein IJ525_06240 [Alphaproteobacteria bacterium]|nr:hypothetical protein [Alphaproteobacteria bacterium]